MNDQVLEESVLATVDQLNLFQTPVIQSAIERSSILEFRPTTQLNSTSDCPIRFFLGGDSRHYLDISRTRLHVKAKLVRADGSQIEKSEIAAPVNQLLQSLWSSIELKISGKTVCMTTNGTYPYVAYFQTLLKQSDATKSSQLCTQMYFKENGGVLMDENPEVNLGFVRRKQLFEESAIVSMEGPLAVDFWSTNRFLLCNTSVDLTLFRSRPEFVVQAKGDENYKISIVDVFLRAHYVIVSPGVISGQAAGLRSGANALFPYVRTECKTFNIASGSRSFRFDNVLNSSYPQRILIAFVRSDSFSGKKELNPFFFHHFDLSQIEVSVDGVSVPGRPISCKFDDKGRDAAEGLLRLYDCIGTSNSQLFSNGLDITDFVHGFSIFAFPLNAGDLGNNFLEVMKTGNISVQGVFGSATDKSVTMILYSESTSVIEIDQSRNVTVH
ncbi:MAG: hypothetical protein AAFZ15_34600 [Bacteroidota bacterium]